MFSNLALTFYLQAFVPTRSLPVPLLSYTDTATHSGYASAMFLTPIKKDLTRRSSSSDKLSYLNHELPGDSSQLVSSQASSSDDSIMLRNSALTPAQTIS